MAASSTAALGLALPVEQLLRTGAFLDGARPWLALAVVLFIGVFLVTARR
jgi:hypothetical protein